MRWTTAQAPLEREPAEFLGVPHDDIMLVAFTIGTDFRPAKRVSRDQVPHGDEW